MSALLSISDLARRYSLKDKTVRDVTVHKPGFPRPIYTGAGERSRRWREDEVMRWEITEGRRAA